MPQINNTKKPPQFDGSNYPYWKAKMTTYIKSINRKVWKVVETKIEIEDEEARTAAEEMLLQNNGIALSAIHDALDERTFEQIKNIERAHEAWKKLEESFEGTQAVKGAKAYILKEKFASFCLHQNLEEESQELKSSQDHVIKESIACRSESADSNAALESAFFR